MNKANELSSLEQLGIVIGHETMEAIAEALPENCSLKYSVSAAHANIYPVNFGVVEFRRFLFHRVMARYKFGYDAEQAVTVYEGTVAKLNAESWTWSGWTRLATATPPQEFDLPLASGLRVSGDNQSTYKRSQDYEVTVTSRYEKSGTEDDIPNAICVCTLPEGYRPTRRVSRRARVVSRASNSADQTLYADAVVYPDGTVIVNLVDQLNYRIGILEFSFPAAL